MESKVLSFLKFLNSVYPIEGEIFNTPNLVLLRKKFEETKDSKLSEDLEQGLRREASSYLTLILDQFEQIYSQWEKSNKTSRSKDNEFIKFSRDVLKNSQSQSSNLSFFDIVKTLLNAYYYLLIEHEVYPQVFNAPPKKSNDTLTEFIQDQLFL